MSATFITPRPRVLIVGGGLGGLLLGAMLERCDIPYAIFERASIPKPLGSAMSIGGQLAGVLKQLGIYEKFLLMGKPFVAVSYHRESGKSLMEMDYSQAEKLCGDCNFIIPRPQLFELLLDLIPSHKIVFGKRVLNVFEEKDKIVIQTADNFTYEGDIVVGADGAYSAVRQRLYETLKKEGKLPKSDQEDLPFSCTCLVGQTAPLDVAEWPQLRDPNCTFFSTLGDDKPFAWTVFPTTTNIAWMVVHQLDTKSTKAAQEQRFRQSENSEWGPIAAKAMCDETREFPVAFGDKTVTMGDLIDLTPQRQISMVLLEEKIFKTWHHGRAVLLGDACHKLNPAGGQGATTAMHDAIALGNLIYSLPSTSQKDIEQAFIEYRAERYGPAVVAYDGSQLLSKTQNKGIVGKLTFTFMKHQPAGLWKMILANVVKNRPYIGFIQAPEDKGTQRPSLSPSTEKAKAIYERRMGLTAVSAV